MSKQKMLGDIPLTELTMKGLVIDDRVINRVPTVLITKSKEDPGAAYFVFNSEKGLIGVLRAVYDPDKARNVPEHGDPDVAAYRLHVGYDNLDVIVGNYDISMEDDDADTHTIADEILLFMEACSRVQTLHDSEGFVKLRTTAIYNDRLRRHYYDAKAPSWYRSRPLYDINVTCRNVNEDDHEIISLVGMVTIFANRVNVDYNGYHPVRYGGRDMAVMRKVLPQESFQAITKTMEEYEFAQYQIDEFVETLCDKFITLDDEKRRRAMEKSPSFFEDDDDDD